jgi:o-succinylbenzoate synthase
MIITDITITRESIPLKTPFITALRRVDMVEFIRVRVATDSGHTGIGEAPPTKAITGEDEETITRAITESIRPALTGCRLDEMESLQTLLHQSCEGNYSAKAAVDIALYDLFSQLKGLPLCRYLGGTPGEIETDITISLNDPATMADDALRALNDGVSLLKIKVGGHDGLDVERVRAVRCAAPDATLLIDANQAWNETETIRFIDAVKALDIALVEQPVPAGEFESMQAITHHSAIPILADESVFSLEDAKQLIEGRGADMINIKLMKCGGIHEALKIIRLCRLKHVKCMMGSMLEGPWSIHAALHLSMAFPETIVYHDLDSPLLYKTPPTDMPVRCRGNRLS